MTPAIWHHTPTARDWKIIAALVYGPVDLDVVWELAADIGRQHFEARLSGNDDHEDCADRWGSGE